MKKPDKPGLLLLCSCSDKKKSEPAQPPDAHLRRYALGLLRDAKLLVKQASVHHALREDALDPLGRRERSAFHSTWSMENGNSDIRPHHPRQVRGKGGWRTDAQALNTMHPTKACRLLALGLGLGLGANPNPNPSHKSMPPALSSNLALLLVLSPPLERARTPGNLQLGAHGGQPTKPRRISWNSPNRLPAYGQTIYGASRISARLNSSQPRLLQPTRTEVKRTEVSHSLPGAGWSLTLSRSSPSFKVGIDDAKLTLQFAPRMSRPFACVPPRSKRRNKTGW